MSLHFQLIAENTGFSQKQLRDVYALFNDGATLPFVARYQKIEQEELMRLVLKKLVINLTVSINLYLSQIQILVILNYAK